MSAANENVTTAHARELLNAAKNGDLATVHDLVTGGVDVDVKDSHDQTPLFLAALNDHKPVVEFLLAMGADPDAKNIHNLTPIFAACEKNNYSIVNLLILNNANVNAKSKENITPLHIATWKGDIGIVSLLLNAGADPSEKNNMGRTVSNVADQFGHHEIRSMFNDMEDMEYNSNESPVIGRKLHVPIYDAASRPKFINAINVPATIVEIGPCQLEITEAAVTNFANKFEELQKDAHVKEVLHYAFPSLFPTEAPIASISDENPLKAEERAWDLLKTLNTPGLNIIERRAKLSELMRTIANEDIVELLQLSHNIIKPTQIIKVKFQNNNPDYKFGYYVLYDCSTNWVVHIADQYSVISELDEEEDVENILAISIQVPYLIKEPGETRIKIKSELPDIYSINEIAAINSWITHGLLSTYLMRPEYLKSICTNPIVGDEEFWDYARTTMEEQFASLYSASKVLAEELILYRGSPHFVNYPVSLRTVLATSTVNRLANQFNEKRLARQIKAPAGTHIIDLQNLNIVEREILIIPSRHKLAIEPIFISESYAMRNQYLVRNANEEAVAAAAGANNGAAAAGANNGAAAAGANNGAAAGAAEENNNEHHVGLRRENAVHPNIPGRRNQVDLRRVNHVGLRRENAVHPNIPGRVNQVPAEAGVGAAAAGGAGKGGSRQRRKTKKRNRRYAH
jgi:hypothetical protein